MAILVGDVHGDLRSLREKITHYDIKDTNIIQVGDFGVGIYLDKHNVILNDFLSWRNITLYVCRGNHDDPSYFTQEKWNDFKHLKFVPDYTCLVIDKKKTLFIGGATSIDRTGRTKGINWWPDEIVNYNIDKIREHGKGVDLIISHSAPTKFLPSTEGKIVWDWTQRDPSLLNQIRYERQTLQVMADEILLLNKGRRKRIHWVYGHFHYPRVCSYHLFNARLLEEHEWWELK